LKSKWKIMHFVQSVMWCQEAFIVITILVILQLGLFTYLFAELWIRLYWKVYNLTVQA
jgi:hypothetical protein